METTFRWRSWLGASVIFFLIFGGINVGLAIAVPATLHLNGSFPGVVFGAGDAQLLGRSFAGLRHDNPKLDMGLPLPRHRSFISLRMASHIEQGREL